MAGVGSYDDWTGNVIPDADMRSLDPEAVAAASAVYSLSHPEDDVRDPAVLLSKAGFLKRGKVTVAAAIMLGKASESLVPSSVRIRWRLLDVDGYETDSRVFDGPMVLSAVQAASAVRNGSVEIGGSAPRIVSAYRMEMLKEAIYNAVAHQDYSMGGTVDVIERDSESVTVRSRGSFGPFQPESFVLCRSSPSPSRNRFLREAMSKAGMVPGRGSGIRGMYLSQIHRHFPLPRYYIDDDSVSVTISGMRSGPFPRILDAVGVLDPEDAISLDRLCSGRFVSEKAMRSLISKGLADTSGGVPCAVPGVVETAGGTDREAVLRLLEAGPCTRADVVAMLSARSSKPMTREQLSVKATNILQSLRRDGTVEKASGSTKSATYRIVPGDESGFRRRFRTPMW